MGEFEGVADFGDDGEGLFRSEPADFHGLAKIHTVDEFHNEIEEAARMAEIVDGDDVWMVEAGEHAAFLGEAVSESVVGGKGSRENLEGDKAVEFWLARFEDVAHAAAADHFDDLELG